MLPRFIYLLLFFSIITCLTGCVSNAHFDDSEYRAIGQTTPLNSVISNPDKSQFDAQKNQHYEADGYGNIGEHPSNGIRYGHSLTIRKIIQTIRVHCSAQPLPDNTKSSSSNGPSEPLQYCHYQFPDYCGSQRFSLVENSHQTALIYHDRISQRNILDQVQDKQYAEPGLWDLADQVSVSSPYPEQQLYYQFSGDNAQAWVVGINKQDRAKFGTLYAKAINETVGCF